MIEVMSEEEARESMQETHFHDPIAEDIPVSEAKLKEIASGKRRTINVAWWEIRTVERHHFLMSLPVRMNM